MDLLVCPLDITSSKRPVLQKDELITQTQHQVGLYLGNDKVLDFENGLLYITSHRILWINEQRASGIQIRLEQVITADSQNGFLYSSPKIILNLKHVMHDSSSPVDRPKQLKWTCDICTHVNQEAGNCTECGSIMTVIQKQLITCPTCTFINAANQTKCEICSSLLGLKHSPISTPIDDKHSILEEQGILKLSLRAGGLADCMKAITTALATKAWAVITPKDIVTIDSLSLIRKTGGGVCKLNLTNSRSN